MVLKHVYESMVRETGLGHDDEQPISGITIQNAISRYGYPLIMRLYRNMNNHKDEGTVNNNHPADTHQPNEESLIEIHSIQQCWNVKTLLLINSSGERRKVPMSTMNQIKYIPIDNQQVFKSFKEVYEESKNSKVHSPSKWMVCMGASKPADGISIRAGQIFRITSFSTRTCCGGSKQAKRVKVMMYPSRQTYWLPMNMVADLQYCGSPEHPTKSTIVDIVLHENLPILVKKEESHTYSCVYGCYDEKVLVSCTVDGHVHAFPDNDSVLIGVYPNALSWDTLSTDELKNVKNHVLPNAMYVKHFKMQYSQMGIHRTTKDPPVLPIRLLSQQEAMSTLGAFPSTNCGSLNTSPNTTLTKQGAVVVQDDDNYLVTNNLQETPKTQPPIIPARKRQFGINQQILSPPVQQDPIEAIDTYEVAQAVPEQRPRPVKQCNLTPVDSNGSQNLPQIQLQDSPIEINTYQEPSEVAEIQKLHSRRDRQCSSFSSEKATARGVDDAPTDLNGYEVSPSAVKKPPAVPERKPQYSLKRKDPVFEKMSCTPMAYDPDDTDTEGEESETEESAQNYTAKEYINNRYSTDSFDSDDDYENQSRILINDLTK